MFVIFLAYVSPFIVEQHERWFQICLPVTEVQKQFQHSFAWRTLRHQKFYSSVLGSKEAQLQVIPGQYSSLLHFYLLLLFFCEKGSHMGPRSAPNLVYSWWLWTSDSYQTVVMVLGSNRSLVPARQTFCQQSSIFSLSHLPLAFLIDLPFRSLSRLKSSYFKLRMCQLYINILYTLYLSTLRGCNRMRVSNFSLGDHAGNLCTSSILLTSAKGKQGCIVLYSQGTWSTEKTISSFKITELQRGRTRIWSQSDSRVCAPAFILP